MARSKRQIEALKKATLAAQSAWNPCSQEETELTPLLASSADFSELGGPAFALLPASTMTTRTTRSGALAVSKATNLTFALRTALSSAQKKLSEALQRNQKKQNKSRQLKTDLENRIKESKDARSQLATALDDLSLERDASTLATRRSLTVQKHLKNVGKPSNNCNNQ
ncbi:hypothetical protein SCHPADRAFT_895610 [Schizopora paradoxa]|uniref:Uncharacterized protein n=1 Tax=Schizopora paradoxa TaxID=27342 RepID=A0A0H2R4J2_9AGAM|nr:hypothetical protein SCHPADRAFT_895610 [Schizopora paradoxa]